MIHVSLTSKLSNVSFNIFRELLIMVSNSMPLLLLDLLLILMPIGRVVLTPVALPLAIVCLRVTTCYHGRPNVKPQSPARVPKSNTAPSPMTWLKLIGSFDFLRSFIVYYLRPHLFFVTMLLLFTCPIILSSTNAPSILRFIFILFTKRLPLAPFECFMYHLPLRLRGCVKLSLFVLFTFVFLDR